MMRVGFEKLIDEVFQGNNEAWITLNDMYFEEDEINFLEVNAVRRVYSLTTGVDNKYQQSVGMAYCMLGDLQYRYKKNYQRAIYYYDKAIFFKNVPATNNRALMHTRGDGGPVNYPEAIRLYDIAIEEDYIYAFFNRGVMHEKGQGGPVNYPEAIRLYRIVAEKGSVFAMYNLAVIYKSHFHDYLEAKRWYEKAIVCRCEGNPSTIEEAMHFTDINYGSSIWAIEQMKKGYSPAINALAVMYNNRMLSEVDDNVAREKALRLYGIAIEAGYTPAMSNRAVIYAKENNYPEAVRLYEMAIAKGDSYAMHHYATFLIERGQYLEAVKLWRQAVANIGLIDAQKALADLRTAQPLRETHPDYPAFQYHLAISKKDDQFATLLKKFPEVVGSYFLDDTLLNDAEKMGFLLTLDRKHAVHANFFAEFFLKNINVIIAQCDPPALLMHCEVIKPLTVSFSTSLRKTVVERLLAMKTPESFLSAGLILQSTLDDTNEKNVDIFEILAFYKEVIKITGETRQEKQPFLYQSAELLCFHLEAIYPSYVSVVPPTPAYFKSFSLFKAPTDHSSEKLVWGPFEKNIQEQLQCLLQTWPDAAKHFYLKDVITNETSPIQFIKKLMSVLVSGPKDWTKEQRQVYEVLRKIIQESDESPHSSLKKTLERILGVLQKRLLVLQRADPHSESLDVSGNRGEIGSHHFNSPP